MMDWFQKRTATRAETALPIVPVGQGGFLAGTHVASNLGWRPIEAICVGDKVLTFDHGMQPVKAVSRETILVSEGELAPDRCPLLIPRDALNNRVPMWAMPDQGVLLESDLVEDAQGDPFAVVPASSLEGYRGIRRLHPGQRIEVISLEFERDEVIYLEAGMLAYCPESIDLTNWTEGLSKSLYRVLTTKDARNLAVAMIAVENCVFTAPMPPGGGAGFTINNPM